MNNHQTDLCNIQRKGTFNMLGFSEKKNIQQKNKNARAETNLGPYQKSTMED